MIRQTKCGCSAAGLLAEPWYNSTICATLRDCWGFAPSLACGRSGAAISTNFDVKAVKHTNKGGTGTRTRHQPSLDLATIMGKTTALIRPCVLFLAITVIISILNLRFPVFMSRVIDPEV